MVRFVIAIGVLVFLGFMLWIFLPMFEGIFPMINSTTTNATALELAQWRFMPIAITVVIVVCVIWHYFGHKGEGEE